MRFFLKDLLRRFLYVVLRISHVQGGKRNIILFSTRRGGSTLFSQLITISDSNLRYYDHLFSSYQTDFYSRRFFNPERNNQEIYLTNDNQNYFELVNTGKHIARTICNPFSHEFVRKSNRILYKITEGKGLFDWFVNRKDVEVIYQLRHPIPTALSIMRLGWDLTLDAYLSNQNFIAEYLDEDKYNYCISIKNGEDLLSKYVLNWVLENLIPLKSKSLYTTYIISYEELLINPELHLFELCKRLDLNNQKLMYDMIKRPSRSSSFSSKETIQNMKELDVQNLIGSWKKDVDDKTEKRLMNILIKFELDIYRFGDLSINKKYTNHATK